VGFSLRRASTRLRAKRRVAPVARQAESFVCRGLDIVKDGEMVTEVALQEFARRFEG
jgi:ribulose 1,5-bisphosphate carboxylase large subunit-like protein